MKELFNKVKSNILKVSEIQKKNNFSREFNLNLLMAVGINIPPMLLFPQMIGLSAVSIISCIALAQWSNAASFFTNRANNKQILTEYEEFKTNHKKYIEKIKDKYILKINHITQPTSYNILKLESLKFSINLLIQNLPNIDEKSKNYSKFEKILIGTNKEITNMQKVMYSSMDVEKYNIRLDIAENNTLSLNISAPDVLRIIDEEDFTLDYLLQHQSQFFTTLLATHKIPFTNIKNKLLDLLNESGTNDDTVNFLMDLASHALTQEQILDISSILIKNQMPNRVDTLNKVINKISKNQKNTTHLQNIANLLASEDNDFTKLVGDLITPTTILPSILSGNSNTENEVNTTINLPQFLQSISSLTSFSTENFLVTIEFLVKNKDKLNIQSKVELDILLTQNIPALLSQWQSSLSIPNKDTASEIQQNLVHSFETINIFVSSTSQEIEKYLLSASLKEKSYTNTKYLKSKSF